MKAKRIQSKKVTNTLKFIPASETLQAVQFIIESEIRQMFDHGWEFASHSLTMVALGESSKPNFYLFSAVYTKSL